jgi:hypothetical protein
LLLVALAGGCTFSTSLNPDAATDPNGEKIIGSEPPAMNCYGTGLGVTVCLNAKPSEGFAVAADRTINTTSGAECAPEITAWCVVAATSISIAGSATLGAQGTRPLVLLSTSTITVNGVLDVASHLATLQDAGPGANASACVPGTAAATRGGGWGGSLGTRGGNGGGVTGATASPMFVPTALHGGCPGSVGANLGGNNGHGGGAVDLIAETSILVTGTINASGKSGSSTTNDGAGGGGGGSGGMIVFDTPMLTFGAVANVFANGGGGGEGTAGNTGLDGTDPVAPGFGGIGGKGGTTGGDGGDGGYNALDGTSGTNGVNLNNDGGGGGGGGAGVIKVFRGTAPALGIVSPPFT